jgi:hypothetical protein
MREALPESGINQDFFCLPLKTGRISKTGQGMPPILE